MKHGYPDLIEEAGKKALFAHPFRVLICAQKEGLSDLMDRAAKEVFDSSPQHAAQNLPPEMFVTWV